MSLLRQFFGTSSNSWVRALIIFCLAWALLVYVFVTKLNTPNTVEPDVSSRRINQALQMLEASKQRNAELQQMIDTLLNDHVDKQSALKLIQKLEYNIQNPLGGENRNESPLPYGSASNEPTIEYELLRRRIQNNIGEIWNYFSNELGKIRKQVTREPGTDMTEEINRVLIMGAEHKRSLLSDMERLRQLDGYEAWRHKEAKDLSDLVQRRIQHLQNPPDCAKARKLVCKLNKGCGYGCQLHHAVYCFIVAYATERTLILKSRGWRYHKGGWEEVFQPVSDTCFELDGAHANNWPGRPETQVLVLPIIDSLMPRPPYLPLAIPEDLAPRLKRLHGDPIVWWVGQFLKYLLRPQQGTKEFLESGMAKLGWKKPIVGVHVRRTDKVGTEAAFHSIEEYMTHVEDYFLTQEINGTNVPRRIFLASDDARVIEEARKKYPHYEIIGDAEVARMAAVSTRYTDTALNGIILDIHLLSLSDYLVCTFSSQVCRVAYEIMQTLYPDAAHRFKSLDDIYYYGGQNPHNRLVVIPHKARNHDEMHMQPGDLVGVAGNHWDGFSKGKNTRTNQAGLFPSFKVVDKVETAKLPSYPNV
ncbi:alpha-(1,6)-fucosyltransferase [Lucilia cuprina]|uniref:alpha-(1,6)-fucosyltransferase n=1 Tax=Lucilia cuprina TaxID=7375 RepID=UPI001F058CB6|nr:alpha-(1,6)-fucosyltransferase [Lucilia cuprina]XP_046802647.1 alpha-(1,6)-fucosyltransferase [Lucilia cuprina]XP_046802648.1 alpha-(1,6)-fucosyltransferase [Lucilia cuprina]XP_046802649.1 alpha-(1,6)-fucosyltransferase [Lucilia cuprina]XP_046802650.1 alpha-(1,6)-fucosyltransferase [Lucilia cuprina]XP_046802651.1 alpha-(1,6)-fucosyltransferase [Lucilia cuprina]